MTIGLITAAMVIILAWTVILLSVRDALQLLALHHLKFPPPPAEDGEHVRPGDLVNVLNAATGVYVDGSVTALVRHSSGVVNMLVGSPPNAV